MVYLQIIQQQTRKIMSIFLRENHKREALSDFFVCVSVGERPRTPGSVATANWWIEKGTLCLYQRKAWSYRGFVLIRLLQV